MDGSRPVKRLDREVLQRLAPLPETVLHLLCLLDDPDARMRDISAVVARDIALAARVLRLANSPQYGLSRAIGDVTTALQVVGTEQTRQLVLASGVMDMARGGLAFYGLSDRAFRQHCEQVGTLSMFVARAVQYGDMGLAYTAGLLHDMGKIVINALAKARPDVTPDVVADATATCGGQLCHVEYALCGADHARAGGELAELWCLPAALSRAVAEHHLSSHARAERSLTACVAIANALASALDPYYPAPNRVNVLPDSPVVDTEALLEDARAFVAVGDRSAGRSSC
jgi:putative nucleotidyltransferase with HDIG domain